MRWLYTRHAEEFNSPMFPTLKKMHAPLQGSGLGLGRGPPQGPLPFPKCSACPFYGKQDLFLITQDNKNHWRKSYFISISHHRYSGLYSWKLGYSIALIALIDQRGDLPKQPTPRRASAAEWFPARGPIE